MPFICFFLAGSTLLEENTARFYFSGEVGFELGARARPQLYSPCYEVIFSVALLARMVDAFLAEKDGYGESGLAVGYLRYSVRVGLRFGVELTLSFWDGTLNFF